MHIDPICNYNELRYSGCTEKLANALEDGRLYLRGVKYGLQLIPVMSAFGFTVKFPEFTMFAFPIAHPFQFLSVHASEDEFLIDYHSPISSINYYDYSRFAQINSCC